MNNEIKAKRVAYDWFRNRSLAGRPIMKDVFLYDRELWDSMQKDLMSVGENMIHDEVKELIRRMDKGGLLGGVAEGLTFDEQLAIVEIRQNNCKETGHPDGANGIAKEISKYYNCVSDAKLAEYYKELHWQRISREYRASKNWTCELCLKEHAPGSGSLVTHHLSYKLQNGATALYAETSRELMALCAEPCHQLADIARYIRVGRISDCDLEIALRPLFARVR